MLVSRGWFLAVGAWEFVCLTATFLLILGCELFVVADESLIHEISWFEKLIDEFVLLFQLLLEDCVTGFGFSQFIIGIVQLTFHKKKLVFQVFSLHTIRKPEFLVLWECSTFTVLLKSVGVVGWREFTDLASLRSVRLSV